MEGKVIGMMRSDNEPLVYSPDSMHLVYSAKKDAKWFYMLKDKPYNKYYDGFLNDAPF